MIESLDTRNLQEELKELENEAQQARYEDEEPSADTIERISALTELRDDIGSEWKYGVQLIREDCFEEYAQELAEDLGLISRDMDWPSYCIDWERAARDLQMDYTSVEFDGFTWLYRA